MVLPLPFAPTTPSRSPRMMRMEKSRTMGRGPKLLSIRSASITSAPDCSASAAPIVALPTARRYSRRLCRRSCSAAKRRTLRLRRAVTPYRSQCCSASILRSSLCWSSSSCARTSSRHASNEREAELQPPGRAAVEPDRGARQVAEETAVVADQHQGRAPRVELALEPLDGRQVEMVGRLVEQQDVGGRARAPAQAPRAALRRPTVAPDPPRRTSPARRGDTAPDADRRRARGPPAHSRARSRDLRGRAPAAGSGWSRPAARSGCRGRAR